MKLRRIINDPPNDYYSKLAFVESSNNPLAKAKTSSAAGLYQFTEGTWNQLTDELGLNYTLDDRFDPQKSRKVVEEFTKRNERSLKNRLGREPNEAELYLAHFSGAGGAGKLLDTINKDPNTPVTNFVSKGALRANKSIFFNKDGSPKKAYEIYNWSAKKFDSPLMDRPVVIEKPIQKSALARIPDKEKIVPQMEIDNTAVKRRNIPNLATPPINPEYASLPELESTQQMAAVSQQEQQQSQVQAVQERYSNAFQQQQVAEEIDYQPQPQEDLSHLYRYINLQD